MSEPERLNPWRRLTTRQANRRAELAAQPWPAFFRRLAIETALIAGVVAIVALVVWLLTR
jgi:hypothetical protein